MTEKRKGIPVNWLKTGRAIGLFLVKFIFFGLFGLSAIGLLVGAAFLFGGFINWLASVLGIDLGVFWAVTVVFLFFGGVGAAVSRD
jgi:hypothetical protein